MTNKIPMINKVGLSVQVDPEFYTEILKLSQELDLSISKLQRKALKEFIKASKRSISKCETKTGNLSGKQQKI